MKSVRFVVALALLAVSVGGALAQPVKTTFPNRPLRYIVPFPPIGLIGSTANALAVHPSVPAATIADSSLSRKRVRARSTTRRPASGPRRSCRWSCSG